MSDHMSEEELLQLISKLNTTDSKDSADKDIEEVRSPDSDGTIEIANNKIIVRNPAGTGRPPTLKAEHPIKLRKNGQFIHTEVELYPEDKIEWLVEDPPLYTIEISSDCMEVHLLILSKERYDWRLKNHEAANHIILEAEKDPSIALETIRLTDVMNTLNKMNISKNVQSPAIYNEIQNPTYEPVLIAHGVRPTESKNAELTLNFNEQVESAFLEIGGSVDFRNHLQIPSVNIGEKIAHKTAPIEGAIGYNVYGEIVKPEPPKDIVIVARDHVEIIENGDVIALKQGRPRITGQQIKYFDVSTSYIVTGDVDLKTGNIVFSGDVIVYGNVLDGMIIESLGNIYISGSAYRAKLTSTGSIHIKGNIVACELNSGHFGVIFNRLYLNSKKLYNAFTDIIEASKLLIRISEAKGKVLQLGQVFMILMEHKFKDIVPTVNEILNCVRSIQNINKEEFIELRDKLQLFSQPINLLKLESFSFVYSVQNTLRENYEAIERTQEDHVRIDISQCHLSQLKSNGDTLIRKEGVLQSHIYSKENIIFYHNESVCRGSQLEAGGTIAAMKVGGETGGETILKAGKRITLSYMNMGRVSIDRFFKDIDQPLQNATISANQQGIVIKED